ncbi:MAG: preprotein translocase subunit SecA [Candidatus Dependentiae bacterium]|nr:preprotein translocase subunit SecA [Candidatus Dependentiae bacterium]
MIARLLAIVLGTNNARQLRQLQPIIKAINAFEPAISALSDADLAHKTIEFKEQINAGKHLDDILPEAFAVVREAAKRVLHQRHYDVQLIGGIVLHKGKISEMKTGEGKTLTATLPLYLNALTGKGAHLVTVNEYLARRDAEWMGKIFNFLGLSVAALYNSMSDEERKKAYQADILYATNSELGFDYLRDNMKFRLEDYVQRDLNFAIVDEVDSILIDEARTPLIISGSSDEEGRLYVAANKSVQRLKNKEDYEVDEKARTVQLTEAGNDKIEGYFKISNLYDIENLSLLHHVQQALKANVIFQRDVDYVVKDGEVLIVDEFTGRILPGRRYSDGLHQALEAKENVEIEKETQTLASITLQNYFRLYKKLAGMTGTAATEAEEFYKIYKLDVVSIPTHRPMVRQDKPDFIFLTRQAKYNAIVEDVKERYKKGQPVLVGTVAIETSEYLSALLTKHNIPHDVLNAKQHQREADIVSHAGELGRITIATNMAGRGTDIKLTPESIERGGLYILGTERHESRRIDNQLRGRAGRQGDPGESRFYIALEDSLIRRFAGDTLYKRMQLIGMKEDEIIESKIVSRQIEKAQEKVEKYNFEIRKHLIEYDDVLNQQRKVIYSIRRNILEGEEHIYTLVRDMIAKAVEDMVYYVTQGRALTNDQAVAIMHELSHLTAIDLERLKAAPFNKSNTDAFLTDLINFLLNEYQERRKQIHNIEQLDAAEKWLMLETIDQAWKQHMLNLDHLKEGIGLRGMGQKNPLIEYKREAFAMFKELMMSVRHTIVGHVFHLNIERFNEHDLEHRRQKEMDQMKISSTADEESIQEPRHVPEKIGRNDDCPCGSGKKYKKCHGR